MQNGNETWHILKSIYVEKTPIIVLKMMDQFCWSQQKLSILSECPNFCPKVVFFNYSAINDNKITNNHPRTFSWDLLTRPLTEH